MNQSELIKEINANLDLEWEMDEIRNCINSIEDGTDINDVSTDLYQIILHAEMIAASARAQIARINNEATED